MFIKDSAILFRLHFIRMETEPQNLRNFAHNHERIGVDLFYDTAKGGHLSAADHADQHTPLVLRVHTLRRDGRDASAELLHQRRSDLVGLVGDDTEFDCGVEPVRDRFVRLTFYVRFKGRHHNGKQGSAENEFVGARISFVKNEYGAPDNDAVDHKDDPCNRGSVDFLLNHNRRNIRSARTAADLKGERRCQTDAKPCCKRGENFLSARTEFNDEMLGQYLFEKEEEQGLQTDIHRGKDGKPLFHKEEGKRNERKVESKKY